jgi:hypothetical protein
VRKFAHPLSLFFRLIRSRQAGNDSSVSILSRSCKFARPFLFVSAKGLLDRSYRGAQMCAAFQPFPSPEGQPTLCTHSSHKAVQICATLFWPRRSLQSVPIPRLYKVAQSCAPFPNQRNRCAEEPTTPFITANVDPCNCSLRETRLQPVPCPRSFFLLSADAPKRPDCVPQNTCL